MTSTPAAPEHGPAAGPPTARHPAAGPVRGRSVPPQPRTVPVEEVGGDAVPRPESPRRRDRSPGRRPTARRVTPRRTRPRDPLPGLVALVLLSLLATFFAWVSAAPIWLAVGHSTDGTVVIAECTGGGLTQRCRGIFHADGGRFVARGVRVSGVPAERNGAGTELRARMTGADAHTAYADTGAGRHLRWLLGLLLVLSCGAGIARWTGASRLPDRRERRWAVGAALAGPLLLTLGFLAAAW